MNSLENTWKAQPAKNIQNGFQPIYYFSRCIGLWPFTIAYNPNGSIKVARVHLVDIFWFLISICLHLTTLYYAYEYLVKNTSYNLKNILYIVTQIPPLLFGAIGIVLDMIYRNSLVNILNKFNVFDKAISKFGIHFSYKADARRAFFYLMAPILIAVFLQIVDFFMFQFDWKHLSTILWIGPNSLRPIVCILAPMSFVIFIRCLYLRFDILNSLLRNRFLTSNRLKISVEIHTEQSIDVIKFVGRQHAFLIDITDQLNVCYSFQILTSTAAAFMFAILTTYEYCEFMIQVEQTILLKSCVRSGWLMLYMGTTLSIIYYSNLLTNEGKRTGRIVHDIVNCCHDSDMIESLGQLSQQSQLRYPVVSCGLFVFDWSLLFNMMAAIATYLVIVLNFETTAKKN